MKIKGPFGLNGVEGDRKGPKSAKEGSKGLKRVIEDQRNQRLPKPALGAPKWPKKAKGKYFGLVAQ